MDACLHVNYSYLTQKKTALEGLVHLTAPDFQSSLFQREPRGSGPCKLSTDILYKSHCLVSYFWHPLSVCLQKKKKISLGLL